MWIERRGGARGRLIDATDDLRDVARVPLAVAGIDPLRREREEEVFACLEAALFEHRLDDLDSRAGVCRGLENHELSTAQAGLYAFDGRHDVGHVGGFCLWQGGR